MYCGKCGVELSDTEKACPLCGTVPYHPELERQEAEPLYPRMVYPQRQLRPAGWLFFTTFASVISILVACICDLHISDSITWSGYVAGALLLIYSVIVLPYWMLPSVYQLGNGRQMVFELCLPGGGWHRSHYHRNGGAGALHRQGTLLYYRRRCDCLWLLYAAFRVLHPHHIS